MNCGNIMVTYLRAIEAMGRLLEPNDPQTASVTLSADGSGAILYGKTVVAKYANAKELDDILNGTREEQMRASGYEAPERIDDEDC